jgi:hypothetical protein
VRTNRVPDRFNAIRKSIILGSALVKCHCSAKDRKQSTIPYSDRL